MEKDKKIIELLRARCGNWTVVVLENGKKEKVLDIAWGYDLGDEWAHITTNISPGPSGETQPAFFYTNEIIQVLDEDGKVLYDGR